jgi:acyl-CoA thioester hydrolase
MAEFACEKTPAMSDRPLPEPRSAYRRFIIITTRWMDNDVYGHVNNVHYYSFFDTAVSGYLVESGAVDPQRSDVIGLAVESKCNYFESLSFPEQLEAGLRVGHMGTSSVRYEVGIFRAGAAHAAAQGHFVHVYVARATQRPVPLPEQLKQALAPLLAG